MGIEDWHKISNGAPKNDGLYATALFIDGEIIFQRNARYYVLSNEWIDTNNQRIYPYFWREEL